MSLIVDQRGVRGVDNSPPVTLAVEEADKKKKPVAWVYECRQPGDDKDNWAEFFSREEPLNPDDKSGWLRNVRPLFGEEGATSCPPVTPAPEIDLSSLTRYEESNGEGGGVYPDPKGLFVRLADVEDAMSKEKNPETSETRKLVDLRDDNRFAELLSQYGDSFTRQDGSIDPEPLIQYVEQKFRRSANSITALTDAQVDDMSHGYCPSGKIGELRELCRAVEATLLSSNVPQKKVGASVRGAILQAITSCGHKIDDDAVTLFATNKEEGNALSQMMDRIMAILPASLPASPKVLPNLDLTATGLMNLWRKAETLASMRTPPFVLYARMLLADAQPPEHSQRAELTEEMQKKLNRYEWIAARFTGYDFYWGGKPLAELEEEKGKCVIIIECGQEFPAQRDVMKAIDSVLAASSTAV